MSVKPSRIFKVKKRIIGLETLLRISQHGDGAYLFLSKDVVDVFHLLPGDRVQARLVSSYRLISAEEEDVDAAREEKVEKVLVVPRQRRRRRKVDLDSEETAESEPPPESQESENEDEIAAGEL